VFRQFVDCPHNVVRHRLIQVGDIDHRNHADNANRGEDHTDPKRPVLSPFHVTPPFRQAENISKKYPESLEIRNTFFIFYRQEWEGIKTLKKKIKKFFTFLYRGGHKTNLR
jgi:hypothetical protein